MESCTSDVAESEKLVRGVSLLQESIKLSLHLSIALHLHVMLVTWRTNGNGALVLFGALSILKLGQAK